MSRIDSFCTQRNLRIVIATVGFLALVTGCQHQDVARAAAARQERALQQTARTLTAQESRRTRSLAHTMDTFRYLSEHDQRQLDESLEGCRAYIEEAPARWNHRRGEIDRELADLLRGSPEDIELIAIRMLY